MLRGGGQPTMMRQVEQRTALLLDAKQVVGVLCLLLGITFFNMWELRWESVSKMARYRAKGNSNVAKGNLTRRHVKLDTL